MVRELLMQGRRIALRLGDIYAKQGKFDAAVAIYHEGQELEKKYGETPAHGTWLRIANAYIVAGRYEEGLPALQRSYQDQHGDAFGSHSSEEPPPFMY